MFVFGNIAQMGTDEIPRPYSIFRNNAVDFFATNAAEVFGHFVNNAGLLAKFYFPRFIMPIAYVVKCVFYAFEFSLRS
jgi:ABC-type polysaccharide/polyol phosphate export permease